MRHANVVGTEHGLPDSPSHPILSVFLAEACMLQAKHKQALYITVRIQDSVNRT